MNCIVAHVQCLTSTRCINNQSQHSRLAAIQAMPAQRRRRGARWRSPRRQPPRQSAATNPAKQKTPPIMVALLASEDNDGATALEQEQEHDPFCVRSPSPNASARHGTSAMVRPHTAMALRKKTPSAHGERFSPRSPLPPKPPPRRTGIAAGLAIPHTPMLSAARR